MFLLGPLILDTWRVMREDLPRWASRAIVIAVRVVYTHAPAGWHRVVGHVEGGALGLELRHRHVAGSVAALGEEAQRVVGEGAGGLELLRDCGAGAPAPVRPARP
jgi:hypothetical protein